MTEELQIRIHGSSALPTLIYLPGLHGDWTLVAGLRASLAGRVRFVEFTYPRTLTWSLDDYAGAVEAKLIEHGITLGWLLGESFGSQIVWPLLRGARCEGRGAKDEMGSPLTPPTSHFKPDGVILGGGFVRHPMMWGVRLAGVISGAISVPGLIRILSIYASVVRVRHRHSPEITAGIRECITRRTELDKAAIQHRTRLIENNDARPIAASTTLPVFHLTGAMDIVVPWPPVQWWLRRNCPGYRGGAILWYADHPVLANAFRGSARQILEWMKVPASP